MGRKLIDKNSIRTSSRNAVYVNLKNYCIFSTDVDIIQVTEWINGEGVDVMINNDVSFNLTFGQFDALKDAIKVLLNPKKFNVLCDRNDDIY